MKRILCMAGVNTRPLAAKAAPCPYWLLSVTLIKRKKLEIAPWLEPYIADPARQILFDPGTFSEGAVSYLNYRRFLDKHARPWHTYLQYDEIGDPEATAFYLADMRRRGYDPIPVIQPQVIELDGKRHYSVNLVASRLLGESRVAVGGLVAMGESVRRTYLDELFGTAAQQNVIVNGNVHLLGMVQPRWFERYPATGGDSTTWIPKTPYARKRSVDEWIADFYGEQDIAFLGRTNEKEAHAA